MALTSTPVASNDDATAAQYNNLRTDLVDHTHEGTDTALLKADSLRTVTGNRTLSLPTGADDTLVGKDATQTLKNKALEDSTTTIVDNADNTKKIAFQASGITAGQTRTITMPDRDVNLGNLAPTGAVIPYAGSSAPTDWLLCDGAAVSRSTYAALFAVIGTTYGAGDGSTTFNVPDLRGRLPLGLDNLGGSSANRVTHANADSLGGAEGAETHTLDTTEMPSHTHTTDSQGAHTHDLKKSTGSGGGLDYVEVPANGTLANISDLITSNGAHTHTAQATGGGGAHNNMPPYISLGYIIKT